MKSPKTEASPEAKQRNHHLPADHGCFSHLFTSTSWWSSQREKNHTNETCNKQKG